MLNIVRGSFLIAVTSSSVSVKQPIVKYGKLGLQTPHRDDNEFNLIPNVTAAFESFSENFPLDGPY